MHFVPPFLMPDLELSSVNWWVRPNLNRSHQHPKLEGYQATPRTRNIKGERERGL